MCRRQSDWASCQRLVGGQVDALALNRFDDERRHVPPPVALGPGRIGVAERDHVAPGEERAEAAAEFPSPVESERPGGQAVEGVVAVEDAGPLRGGPGELIALSTASAPELVKKTRSIPGCARATSCSARTPGRREQSICTRFGEVGVEGVVQRLHDGRMPPAQGEDPETGQKIEVSVPFVVDEVATLALDVEAVELEGAEHPRQLGIDVPGVESEVLALAFVQHLLEIKRHAVGSRGCSPGGRDRLVGAPTNPTARASPPGPIRDDPRHRAPGSPATQKGT